MCKRNEDEHRFAQYLVSLVFWHIFYSPAIVKPVSKLDKHNADIIIKSQQDTLEVLSLDTLLLRLVLVVQHSLDLSQSIHQRGNLVPEKIADIINCIVSIFNNIVQKGCGYGLVPKTDIADDNFCDGDGMKYIRFTGTPANTLVCLIGKFKSFLDHIQFRKVSAPFHCSLLQGGIISRDDLVVVLVEF